MKKLTCAALCAFITFGYADVGFADEANCIIVDVQTSEQIKLDDDHNVDRVYLTEIRAISDFSDVEQFASAAKYLLQEAVSENGSAQAEVWFYRAGTQNAERLRDHEFYVAYTPDPSQLIFRDHVWESPYVDREDDLFDRVSASDVCIRN